MSAYEIDLNFYKPPTLLWHLIEKECPHGELIEIKSLLGDFLVEQTMELHAELSSLMEIWSMCDGAIRMQAAARLCAPVAAKELLLSEIRYFVESIRKKATQCGRNLDDYFDSNSCAIRYATNSASSAGISSRCSSRLSANPLQSFRTDSSLSVERISLAGVENTIDNFKGILEEEVDTLMSDIQYIRETLENNFQPIPSLNDLKTERENLGRIDEELNQFVSRTSASTSPDFALDNSRKILNPITSPNKTMPMLDPITTQNQTMMVQPIKANGKLQLETLSNDATVLDIKILEHISDINEQKNISKILPYNNNADHESVSHLKASQPIVHSKNQISNKKLTTSKISQAGKIAAPQFSMAHIAIQTKRPTHVKETNSGFEVDYEINNNIVKKSTSAQRFRNMVQECRQIK